MTTTISTEVHQASPALSGIHIPYTLRVPQKEALHILFYVDPLRFFFLPCLLSTTYNSKILDSRDVVVNKTYEVSVLAYSVGKMHNKQIQT